MKIEKILQLIKNNEPLLLIEFDNKPIEALDAILLEKNGINVPEELIFYNDDNIDCSDIPEMTDKELNNFLPIVTYTAEIDTLYIKFSNNKIETTNESKSNVQIDLDEKGNKVGIEINYFMKFLKKEII